MKLSELKNGHWYTVQLQDSHRVLKFVEHKPENGTLVLLEDLDGYKWVYEPEQLREMTFHESAELIKELLQKLGDQMIDFFTEILEQAIDLVYTFIKAVNNFIYDFIKAFNKFIYETYGYVKCKVLKKHTWQCIDERIECDYENHDIGYVTLYQCKHCGRLKTRIEVL